MPSKQHNPVIDALRFVSILAVVLVHTTTRTLETTSYALEKVPFTLFLNQAARFAVPLFFMISGYVLELNHSHNTNYLMYLKKRTNRILIPYVFWSAIYYFFIYNQNKDTFLGTLFTGNASYQLYFIPSLIIFYLIFPLIHKFYDIICNKWILLLLGILEVLLLYLNYDVQSIKLFYPLTVALLNYFYFIFGIFLAHNQEKVISLIKKFKLLLFAGSVFLASLIFYEGLTGYLKTHNYVMFYSQWRPSVLFYSIFAGGFLYWVFDRGFVNSGVIKTLSRLSFFVFFIHVIILETLWSLFFRNLFQINYVQQFWFDPLYFLLVASVSFGIAYIAHKLPYLSRLTG